MKLFHGTTMANADKILSRGFEDRQIMFADRIAEAIRYAKSYAWPGGEPALIELNPEGLIFDLSGLSYEAALRKYREGTLDGYLSSAFAHNNLANYFMIFNTKKLNLHLERIKVDSLYYLKDL